MIDAEEVERNAFKIARTVRDAMMNIPSKVAAEFAGTTLVAVLATDGGSNAEGMASVQPGQWGNLSLWVWEDGHNETSANVTVTIAVGDADGLTWVNATEANYTLTLTSSGTGWVFPFQALADATAGARSIQLVISIEPEGGVPLSWVDAFLWLDVAPLPDDKPAPGPGAAVTLMGVAMGLVVVAQRRRS